MTAHIIAQKYGKYCSDGMETELLLQANHQKAKKEFAWCLQTFEVKQEQSQASDFIPDIYWGLKAATLPMSPAAEQSHNEMFTSWALLKKHKLRS